METLEDIVDSLAKLTLFTESLSSKLTSKLQESKNTESDNEQKKRLSLILKKLRTTNIGVTVELKLSEKRGKAAESKEEKIYKSTRDDRNRFKREEDLPSLASVGKRNSHSRKSPITRSRSSSPDSRSPSPVRRRSPVRRLPSPAKKPVALIRKSPTMMVSRSPSPVRRRSPIRRSQSPPRKSRTRRSKSPLRRSPGRKAMPTGFSGDF